MKSIFYLAILIIVVSCCMNKDLFYVQHTKVTKEELPDDCYDKLISDINTSWLKHGKQDCHLYNTFSQGIFTEYQECFKGMKVSLLIKLLGQPDKRVEGKLIYVLDNRCDKEMDKNPDYLYRKDIVFIYSLASEIIEDITVMNKPTPYN